MPKLVKMFGLVFLFILLIRFSLALVIKILFSLAQSHLLREGLYEKAILWDLEVEMISSENSSRSGIYSIL